MKTILTVFFLVFLFNLQAQKVKTIVPAQAVVVGNAFQIQYIISDPSSLVSISSPSFDSLHIVSGPNHYKGTGLVDGKTAAIENITYTLVPSRIGRIKIKGIDVSFKNQPVRHTEDVVIMVLPQPRASFSSSSSYTEVSLYAPASKTDLEKLINENLFVRAVVDRTSCFIGEPIVATFTLYSRLQSTSEVINAPSLYGFSVMDILNINEAHQKVETINGKVFNTSILRKLQLYPEQAGKLLIDPMQLQNEIEFNDTQRHDTRRVEKILASSPVVIHVQPLPAKKPDDFTGAVGNFFIEAKMDHAEMQTQQQGKLVIKVSGQGNFIQFAPPIVDWPRIFDPYDPVVTDHINKNQVPAQGSRDYEFPFSTDSPGHYVLPRIQFSFFDPSSRSYKTISSDTMVVDVHQGPAPHESPHKKTTSSFTLLGWVLAALLFVVVSLWAFLKYSRKRQTSLSLPIQPAKPDLLEQLQQMDGNDPGNVLQQVQKILAKAQKEYPEIPANLKEEFRSLQEECMLYTYSNIVEEKKSQELRKRAMELIKKISAGRG